MMLKAKILIVILFIIKGIQISNAQEIQEPDSEKPHPKIFATLYHQHHDFFGEAFSFQGLEGGVIVKQNLYLGVYGAFFISNLQAELQNDVRYIWIGQGGVSGAFSLMTHKRFHPGIQMNLGLFSLRHDDKNFSIFKANSDSFKLKGLVFAPQLFGEFEFTEWFLIRTGLSYNFYGFRESSSISKSDMNHMSFTFGLVFRLR